MRRARPISNPELRLDTFFFSCLGLSKSAFYIIMRDRRSRDAHRSWRMNALDERGREQFNRMMDLRDDDVHYGKSEGKVLATQIPIERSTDDDMWVHQQTNYAVPRSTLYP